MSARVGTTRTRRRLVTAALFLMVITAVAACGSATIQVGYVGSSRPHLIEARYRYFSGQESQPQQLTVGESLTLEYSVVVESGTLTIQILDPGGSVVWQEVANEDTAAGMTWPVTVPGRYRVVVIGEKAVGSFRVTWEVTGQSV